MGGRHRMEVMSSGSVSELLWSTRGPLQLGDLAEAGGGGRAGARSVLCQLRA